MQMNATAWLLLVLLSVLWGGAFFFTAVAVKEVPPLTLVLLRVFFGALCLAAYMHWRGAPVAIPRDQWRDFLIMGLLSNALPFSLIFWAQTTIPSGLASILNATTPIFTIIVAHLFLTDERMAANKAFGIAFGVFGVAVLLGYDVADGADIATLGIIACLAAALFYGFSGVFGRRFSERGLSAVHTAYGQLIGSSVIVLPVALIIEHPWTIDMPGQAALVSILLLVVLSTALAFVVFFHVLAIAGAVNAALVTLLIPVSAILLGWMVLGERLESHHFIGMTLIAVGLITIDGRALRWRR